VYIQFRGRVPLHCRFSCTIFLIFFSYVIGHSVCLSVYLSVCYSVSRITHERGNGRRPRLRQKKWSTFGVDTDPHVHAGSLFHFLHYSGTRGYFRRFISILIQSPAYFYDTWRNDSRRQENEFAALGLWDRTGRDIRIRIIRELWTHFGVGEVCGLWLLLVRKFWFTYIGMWGPVRGCWQLTWADLAFVDMCGVLTVIGSDNQLVNYPKLQAARHRIEQVPNVAAWLAKRPQQTIIWTTSASRQHRLK